MTTMCSLTQRLFDDFPTARTILTGVVRWHGNRCHTKHLAKVFQPISESRPCSIGDGFCQSPIFHHVSHLQIFIGNQVVRLDYAPCQLHGKIFTLPTYFEVLPTQTISFLSSVLRTLLSSRHLMAKTLERFFRFPQMTRILNRLPIRVGIEVGQSHIQPKSFARWLSLLNSLNIKAKLNVVAIGTTNNSYSFNLIQLVEVQITGSPQLKTSSFKTIGESDSSSILRQLPATGFALHGAMCLMLLETGKPLFLGFLLAVVVKPSNSRPSSFVP